jgi:hypothetical protein
MENYRGFLSWMLQGWYRDITIWGLILGSAGFIVMALDGSMIVIWLLLSLGIGLVMFDLVHSFLSWQYSLYKMERDRVARELERKGHGNI